MAIIVMILGESGTGKSASLRNFTKDELAVVNVIGKPLPFRNKHFETLNSDNYGSIIAFLGRTSAKSIVIDDAQYLMANEYMRRAQERGFDKFTEIGQNFWNLVNYCSQKLSDDRIVYFLQHVETSSDGSTIKAKTIGKLIDEKITLEGMFSIVLRTNVNDGEYCFSTQNSGSDTVKSPVGMFDSDLIPNDLALVDKKIRNYYELEVVADLMKTGGYADAVAEQAEQDLKSQEEHHKELLDINAPHVGIIDDETPLQMKTLVDDLRELCKARGIKESEVRAFVGSTGQYTDSVPVSGYEDDFLDYLINNFEKLARSIEKRRK
jgi:hypothetical protein